MSAAAILRLTYPPSANKLWRYVSGRAIKSAEYRAWLEQSAWECAAQKEIPIAGAYAMHIMVSRPDKRRRDISNCIKAVEDAIVLSGMVEDDSLCQRITAEWVTDQPCAVKVFICSTVVR
jgi:crossover junction endodeoxyribonuclease RusA